MTNTVKKSASKYTPAMEARITESQPINKAVSEALAAEFGVTPASVRAKAVRMGVAYARQVPVTKSGAPVEKKEDIVAEIARLVGESLDGLEKAPKPALQALRDHLTA